jgi:type I restriction enzyme S subunit
MTTRPGYKLTGIGEIPQEWEVVRLREIAEIVKDSIDPKRYPDECFELYSIPAYYKGGKPELKLGKEIQSQKLVVGNNTVLFGKINPRVPKVWFVSSTSGFRRIASTEFIPLVSGSKSLASFVYYLAWSTYLLERSNALTIGTTTSRKRVETDAYLDLLVPLPSLPEQQKISSILSTIDDAIQKTDDIIAKTRQLKKGLMQRLLTKGIGHTKFKQTGIGKIPDQWDVVPLKNVGEWYSGGTPSKSKKEYWGGRIPWISPKDMKRVTIDSSSKSITELGLETGSRLVPARSILVVVRGLILARDVPVAMNLVPVTFNQDIKALICSSDFEPEYVLYALLNSKRRLLGMTSMSAHGTKRLSFEELADYGIPHPQLDEQRKIASVLRSVEEKMAFETAMKSHHQTLKRGLMQVLLTGKVRVKVN